jgi:hypothetical protein
MPLAPSCSFPKIYGTTIRAQDGKSSIESPPFALPLFTGRHGRSAVSILSPANGALGEHRLQEIEGIKLEIEAPGCRSSVQYVAERHRIAGDSGPSDHPPAADVQKRRLAP